MRAPRLPRSSTALNMAADLGTHLAVVLRWLARADRDGWRIRGWPTLFLIGHDGVIRARDIVGPELDGLIERFVSVAEQAR